MRVTTIAAAPIVHANESASVVRKASRVRPYAAAISIIHSGCVYAWTRSIAFQRNPYPLQTLSMVRSVI
jgi:hypothetical protein